MSKSILTQSRLRELFDYNPETGVFTWKVTVGARAQIGRIAGSPSNGYRKIQINRTLYPEHRLAWLFVHGRWPDAEIDHINGIKNDNRIANLRDVSHTHNMQNQRSRAFRGVSGYMGVSPHGNSWRAKITVAGSVKHLGMYQTPLLAHEAYLAVKRQLHTTCTI